MEIRQASSVEQTNKQIVSQTDRVLIYVAFTAVIVLKYRGILSLDWVYYRPRLIQEVQLRSLIFSLDVFISPLSIS